MPRSAHLCSSYVLIERRAGSHILNATTPIRDEHAERSARHLRLCREMADIAMQLARAAADRALAEPEPASTHQSRPTSLANTSLANASRANAPRTHTPRIPRLPSDPDPNLVFVQLCRCVRETIILESRLAAERRTITDAEAQREKDRAFAAALNARFPQPAPAPAKPAEKPLWDNVKSEARGPSG